MFSPTVLQQLLKTRKNCNVWVISVFLKSCDVADTCWQKKLARVWFHTSPATLILLKGMLKNMFFPSFATTAENEKNCNVWVISVFFLKVAMLLDKCWQKIGESLVPYFTCHTATFEGDVEKHVFPSFATTAERKKIAVTLLQRHSLLQQLLKGKNAVTLLQRHPHFATTAETKKCCDTLTASLPLN